MNDARRGFTITELMLAMTFISVLLLAIALSVIQIGTIYNKGMTLREVNQAGRAMTDDLRRTFLASSAISLDDDYVTNSAGGRLCLDKYSYIWNFEDAIVRSDVNLTRFDATGPLVDSTVRFVRVPDASKEYCAVAEGAFVLRTIRAADQSKTTELLRTGDRELSIHSLTLPPPLVDDTSGQQLYTMLFSIGTRDVEALTPERTACLAPNEGVTANFSYCAVQEFNIVIRTGNGVN
jgi:prepilin-type N-terminal cleavage/methylation domain-containing protein